MLVEEHIPIFEFLANSGHSVLVEGMILTHKVRFSVGGLGHLRRIGDDVCGPVGVFLQVGLVSADVSHSPETTIKGSSVQDNGILNIIASKGHDGDRGILAGGQLLEVGYLNGASRDERLLRVV